MASEGSITAYTDIDIVNTALIRLGQTTISAFGQNSGTGLILQASYNISRDDLLRKQPWSFARAWITLGALSSAPINLDIIPPPSGPGVVTFSSAYQLPNDCLRVFRFSPKDAAWRVVGRTILTDATPQQVAGTLIGLQPLGSDGTDNQPQAGSFGSAIVTGIEYISRITDPQQWDANFVSCFIWKLCTEMAFGVTGLSQAYQMAKTEYEQSLVDAAVVNGIENWPDPFWNTDLNDVRYGYVSTTNQGI